MASSSAASSSTPRRVRNVCFTYNNPGADPIPFDVAKMKYLVFQRERGENGTEHYQGYVELKSGMSYNAIKTLLGSNTIHLEARRGTAEQARDYCKKDDTRMPEEQPYEFGEISSPGKRNDLEAFKDAVVHDKKRKREMIDEHYGTMARYSKFYDTLTSMSRPDRTEDLEVVLHIGETGLGKTRRVYDLHGADDDFYVTPISNGTAWFDAMDRHTTILIDDFSGASSHMPLAQLLRLLDRYPVQVPTKGSHTWWLPNRVYVTTNILPSLWYKWENRGGQYLALARRFTKVVMFYPKLHEDDPGFVEQDKDWWKENAPVEAIKYFC